MRRGMWIAATLILFGPSSAASQQAGRAAGTKPAAAENAAGKPAAGARKSAGTKPAAGAARSAAKDPKQKLLERKGAKAKEPEDGVPAAARVRVRRTKSVFMYASESCERAGNRCDPTLRDDAELRFMEACGACTTSSRCEAERDAIRGGTARSSSDPCASQK